MKKLVVVLTAVLVVLLGIQWALVCDPRPLPDMHAACDAAVESVLVEPAETVLERAPESFQRGVAEDKARGSRWATEQKHFIAAYPRCAYCAQKADAVHHVLPVSKMSDAQRDHDVPGGEYDWGNLISLCNPHHLDRGHLGNWRLANPDIVAECKRNEKRLRAAGKWPDKMR